MMEDIIKQLKEMEIVQTEMLNDMREIVRLCSRAIKKVHARDYDAAREQANRIKERLKGLVSMADKYPNFNSYRIHAEQEYVELMTFLSCVKNDKIPDVNELNVHYQSYLLGLLDAVGELRRALLDRLRDDDIKDAERMFKYMNEIYELTVPIVFSESLLRGFRGKQDVARRQVEQARSEITMALMFKNAK